jgi:hypothetical protein
MKVLRFAFLVLIASFTFVSCHQNEKIQTTEIPEESSPGVDLNCDREKLKTVVIISELAKIRAPKDAPVSEADKDKIYKLVGRLKEKEDLIALAKITLAFRRHTSGEDLECRKSSIIPVFEIAFWRSVEILAQDKSEENIEEMKRLKEELHIDGGDAYDWSTIVDGIPAP